MVGRRMLVGAAVMALTAAGSALPAYSADDTPPVTMPDEVSVLPIGEASADVLANDTDDADDLAVCRARSDSAPIMARPDYVGVRVSAPYGTPPGDYAAEYQACDGNYLSVGQLTVHVVAPQDVTVEKVDGEPGVLRATNPNPVPVDVAWGGRHVDLLFGPEGVVSVAASGSTDFSVDHHFIRWVASDPTSCCYYTLNGGTVSGITLPGERTGTRFSVHRRLDSGSSVRRAGAPRAGAPRAGAPRAGTTTPADTSTDPWPTDPTTVERPVTSPDVVPHLWAGGLLVDVDVLGNDSDPQGQSLDICRNGSYPAGVTPLVQGDGIGTEFSVRSSPKASGDYTLTYYACNSGRLTPGTVTVHVEQAARLVVRRVAGRPHRIRLDNPNPDTVSFYLMGPEGIVARGDLLPDGHKIVRGMPTTRVDWYGSIGVEHGNAGHGKVPRVT